MSKTTTPMRTTSSISAPRTSLFYGITVLYLAAVVIGAYLLGFFEPTGEPINPAEWGDVLAGVFSPLAFLWLIYASLSQRAELEMQREELKQNNQTQQNQHEQMSKQADALTAQVEYLKRQEQDRERELAASHVRFREALINLGHEANNALAQLNRERSAGLSVDGAKDLIQRLELNRIPEVQSWLTRMHLAPRESFGALMTLLRGIELYRLTLTNIKIQFSDYNFGSNVSSHLASMEFVLRDIAKFSAAAAESIPVEEDVS